MSVGDTATFCAVCGARFEEGAAAATLEATRVVEGPVSGAGGAAQDAAERWAQAEVHEESSELVADLATEAGAGDGLELDADTTSEPDAAPAAATGATPDASPEGQDTAAPEHAPDPGAAPDDLETPSEPAPDLASESASEPGPASEAQPEVEPEPASEVGPEAAPEPAPEPEPAPTAGERKLAEAAGLLEAAAGCEDAATPRAAALYQEAIVCCLDAAGEFEALGAVDAELLRGFDGLSALLVRKGLAEEALAVVEDADSLGLLNGGAADGDGRRAALKDRREDLRRLLFADSAQL